MIPRLYVNNLTVGVNAISKKARDALAEALALIDMTQDVSVVRELTVAAMEGVCSTATKGASILSAEMYNAIREFELGERMQATTDSGRDPRATEGAVRAFAEKLVKGEQEAFVNLCLGRADYEVKVATARTALNNAKRDTRKPRFARVPTGEETCDFCLMLASRGFAYLSEAAASHTHENCDCRVIPSWKSMEVEGYDPDALYDQWQESIDEKAERRSERNGTTVEEERERIMAGYERASQAAKKRKRGA